MAKTLHLRVYSDIVSKIKAQTLRSGDPLDSTRVLAKIYKCHRFTIMRAYQDLAAEGWIDSIERSRYVVSRKVPVINSKNIQKKNYIHDLANIAKPVSELDLEKERFSLEFWGGQPDLRLFPKDEFRRVLSAGLRHAKSDLFNYGHTSGLPSCLSEVAGYLRKSRNLVEKEYVMTNGSQEALLLIFQAFIKPGDKIAVEKKGYPPAWRLFESLGAVLIPIHVDEEGLDTDDLQSKLKKHKIKMIYVTPLHQYPTTVTLSPRRRQQLIQTAEQSRIFILEDDYDHEFHYTGPPPPPLSAETNFGIYVCSFSKILFPGARLGVIACDPQIHSHLAQQKHLISRQTDCLAQIGLSSWIRDGGFERHLRRTCRSYETRYLFMIDELEKLNGSLPPGDKIAWTPPNGGMSIWIDMRKDSRKIVEAAKKRDVFFQHESTMDFNKSVGTHLRIGFACVDQKEIRQGIEILRQLL